MIEQINLFKVLIKGGGGEMEWELETVNEKKNGVFYIYFDYVTRDKDSLSFYKNDFRVLYTFDETFVQKFEEARVRTEEFV